METVIRIFEIALWADAAIVAVGLWRKRNMWPFITLYWTMLAVKNALGVIA